MRSANLPDWEKSECVLAQQEHLDCVQTERDFYRNTCAEAKTNFERFEEAIELDDLHNTCSLDTTIHYSFDFAQQVHIPSNPMQPGPIYFKTPWKCRIFGVMCKAIPRQVNYLTDEASDVGKGANTTISFLLHYFHNHGLGETPVKLHADNCSGQNKNNFFLWYLAWRTIHQLHDSICYSFLIAGHTKFGPNHCFGIIERSYKVSYVSSLYELAQMVESSSTVGVNKAQLVATHDGKVIVPVYNWSAFLEQYFVKVPNIKKFHHFRFSIDEPGKLYFKLYSSSPEQSLQLLKNSFCHPPCFHPRSIPKDYPKNESSICTKRSVSFASLEWKIWLPRRLENKTVLLRTPALLCTSQGKILQVERSTLHSAGSTKMAPLGATTCNKSHDKHRVYNVYPICPIAQIIHSNLDQNAH